MPEVSLFLFILVTFFTVWLGVHVYGRWINHITVYSAAWGVQMVFFQLKFIKYADLSLETTVLVFGAWTIFILASLTFRIFYSQHERFVHDPIERSHIVLAIVFVGLALIGAIGVLQHWMVLLKRFGSLERVIISGNLVYSSLRQEAGIPGMWPYVDSITLAADFLGGYYATSRRRGILLGFIPLVVELGSAIANFGRARLIFGTILWITAFFAPHVRRPSINRGSVVKRALMFALILLVFALGMEFIRAFRGANESFTGETTELSRIKGIGFITPSIYLYLSSDVALLNQFLDYQFEGKLEGTPPGGNTFAPLYRLLSKLDVVEPVKEYEKFYFVPMGTNTGSYLRELYADWGLAGTLSIVYLLGAICSIVYEAYQRKRSLVLLATLAHLNVLVFFTFALQTTRWTYWLISLVASILAGTIVDRYSNNSSPSPQEVVSRF